MASLPNSKAVTYEEWLRMPVVDQQRETVVNGEIRLMPPNTWKHAIAIESLRDDLNPQLDRQKFLVVVANFGLIIRKSPLTSRVPDLAVFELATLAERDGYIHSAPRLIVEVLSPSNRQRNRQELLADYASLGVPEFWIVWLDQRKIEVFVLESGQMRCSQVVRDGILESAALPGVRVAVANLWPQ